VRSFLKTEGWAVKGALLVAAVATVIGCGVLSSRPPQRFPQFDEQRVAGPGVYQIPQWSPDGRYLAYFDEKRDPMLVVFDTETGKHWRAATDVSSVHFSWTPDGDLAYLRYRPELSGSPFPHISELHRVNVEGNNDEIIATNLSSAGDFAWFSDGQQAVILLADPSRHSFCEDVYLLDAATGETTLLLNVADVDLQCVTMLDISPDNTSILVDGIHEEDGSTEAQIVIYSLETQTILDRLIPSEIIPNGDVTYPVPGIGDDTNYGWIGGGRWILGKANTPGGECYNYALFFFDTSDLGNSFCIPSAEGVFAAPTLSPDLTRISYVTVLGPGNDYVVISDVPPELPDRLEVGD
jgi:hypothetical protein